MSRYPIWPQRAWQASVLASAMWPTQRRMGQGEMHADLLRADYWRALQMRIKNGHVEDVYAYRRKQRFSVRYGADSRPDKAFTIPPLMIASAYQACSAPRFLFNRHTPASLPSPP